MAEQKDSLLRRINKAELEKAAGSESAEAVVRRVEAKTTPPIKLNPASAADENTARAIEKAEDLSKPVTGGS